MAKPPKLVKIHPDYVYTMIHNKRENKQYSNCFIESRNNGMIKKKFPTSWQAGLLAAGVLGHGLGSLRHSVLGQLSRQKEPDGSLDLPGGDGGPLVVVGQAAGLGSNPLEQVIDE